MVATIADLPDLALTTIATGVGTVTIIDDDNKIFAAIAPRSGRTASAIDSAVATSALAEALAIWTLLEGRSDLLAGITIELRDLGGLALAETNGSVITLDLDAAGWGWSFGADLGDRMDLMSVLLHEVGHVLGHEHGDGVMAEVLHAGERLDVALPLGDELARSTPIAPEIGTALDAQQSCQSVSSRLIPIGEVSMRRAPADSSTDIWQGPAVIGMGSSVAIELRRAAVAVRVVAEGAIPSHGSSSDPSQMLLFVGLALSVWVRRRDSASTD